MPKISMLGGAGQIAWQLASWLQQHKSCEVIALCRQELLTGPHIAFGRQFKVFDQNSEASIRESIGEAEIVIDCSFAQLGRTRDDAALRRLYESVLSAPTVKHLLHLSSVAVYGEICRRPKLSFQKPEPDTVYGAQKLRTEHLISSIAAQYRKQVLILRLGHVYGPFMSWSSGWVDMLINGAIGNRQWNVPSNAIHIRQICESIASAIESRTTGTWNLVGSPNATWDEIISWHRRALAIVAPEASTHSPAAALAEPKRYQTNAMSLLRESVRLSGRKIVSALIENPPINSAVRVGLASIPFMPSVNKLKDVLGSPAIEAYFNSVPPDPSNLIFDSVQIPGPNLEVASPLGPADFDEFVDALRTTLTPDSVRRFVRAELNLAPPGAAQAQSR